MFNKIGKIACMKGMSVTEQAVISIKKMKVQIAEK
jgi:hypothetical protein